MTDPDLTGSDPSTARRKAAFLGGFALYLAALWFFWNTPVVYPLKIFVVMLHEISHGIACMATGGTVERIILDPYQGGACYCLGGNAFITLSAGYLGSLLWGVALLAAAGSRRIPSRILVLGVGAAVFLLTALYVRNAFGLAFGLAFGAALVAAGRIVGERVGSVAMTVLGLTSCLYAILDIKSDVLDRPHLRSDAVMLAEITPGVSSTAWGVAWIAVAVVVSALALRRAYRAA